MDRKEFHEILRRYIAGNTTDEEKNLVDQWYELLDDESLPEISATELDSIRSGILQNIRNPPVDIPVRKAPVSIKKWHWLAAAVLTGIMAGSFYFHKTIQPSRAYPEPYASAVTNDFIEKRNHSNHPQLIVLEDSSLVTLSPGSGIKYPQHFRESIREVYMQGEAFFEVHKNARRPFYVYNNSIITHVLGTSFTVRADNINNNVQVDVRTGRVEVMENRELLKRPAIAKVNGIILTPNQKVTYHESSGQFEASLSDRPVPLTLEKTMTIPARNFVFDETPLSVVMKEIEDQFGIEIVVEDETILDNVFTGDINKPDLFMKLELVCKSLSICYEIKGTRILIRDQGCN
jgi:ferric-dicitrate binding protein FerR (iron transport regulator)